MAKRACPHCGEQIQRGAVLCRFCRGKVEKLPDFNPLIIYGGGGFLFLVVIAAVALPSKTGRAPLHPVPTVAQSPEPPSAPPPTAEQSKQSKEDALLAITNRDEVLPRLTPLMKDGYDSFSDGSRLLLKWALLHTNKQISGTTNTENFFAGAFFTEGKRGRLTPKKSETSIRALKKDPESARGQRLCVSGRIISIHYERTAVGNFNEGQMYTDSSDVVDYIAVEESKQFERDIVEHSRVKLCGLFTELNDYPNSGGGTSHAIRLIGMFAEKTVPGGSDDDDE